MQDLDDFVALVKSLHQGPWSELRDHFDINEPIFVARAPGRLDVMGGIADYSGSLVLQLPTREATFAAAQKTNDGNWEMVSLPDSRDDSLRSATLSRPTSPRQQSIRT